MNSAVSHIKVWLAMVKSMHYPGESIINIKAFLFLFIASISVFSSVSRVPEKYSTIQQALDSASAFDTILVAPGTYSENLIWSQKSGICLFSEKGSDQTIIEAKINESVCGINTPVKNLSIRGFTIRNGKVAGT